MDKKSETKKSLIRRFIWKVSVTRETDERQRL